ncbi:MAG: RagB/SusD family nutrient uptake outer membrane protein [Draconibacterium sp.]
MRKIIYFIFFVFAFYSCSDYLDVIPDNLTTIEDAFKDEYNTKAYLYTCYAYIPNIENLNQGFSLFGDEMWAYYDESGGRDGFNLNRFGQDAANPRCSYWTGSRNGRDYWQAINLCNNFIENVGNNPSPDLTEDKQKRWLAEAKFLKAFYHFYLLRMYGPIPIKDVNLSVAASSEDVRVKREPIDDVVEYIISTIDEAIPYLPEKIVDEVEELGRISQTIAYSFKAVVRVWAASPLVNGNDGAAFMSYAPNGDLLFPQEYMAWKWDSAAVACKKAIDFAEMNGHRLYMPEDWNYGRANVNDIMKQRMAIRNAVTEKRSPELIWGNTNFNNTGVQRNGFHPNFFAVGDPRHGTQPETGVTLHIVEKFLTSNGVPMDEDNEWINNGWTGDGKYILKEATIDDKYYVKPGRKTVQMHYNREPRFYASLSFDEGAWFGSGWEDVENLYYTDYKQGGNCRKNGQAKYSATGYDPKKLIYYDCSVNGTSVNITEYYPFPYIRLSDLYLLYAEALNERDQGVQAGGDAINYLNKVRERAGFPDGIIADWTNNTDRGASYVTSYEGFQRIIRLERTVELAFEGQRFWDLRRWKSPALLELNRDVQGWNMYTETDNPDDFYVKQRLKTIEFRQSGYFFPLSNNVRLKNPNIKNSPGW